MRFEIGPAGGFVVLVGLLGLSAAVFFLGMISGREMAQSEQGQSQLASVYPMPAAAASATPPEAAALASAAAVSTPKPPPQAVASEKIPPAAMPKPSPGHNVSPRQALASDRPAHREAPVAAAPASTGKSSAPSEEASTGGEARAARAPAPPAAARRNGYNIVIDAAMDRTAAHRMASRLLALGYTSRIIPSQINGETWYRVQVGPYPTQADARAAQSQLRAAYTARYISGEGSAPAGAGAASAGSANPDSSDSGADNGSSNDSGAGDSGPSD